MATIKMNKKYESSEKSVRKMRRIIFDYPSSEDDRAGKVLRYLIKRTKRMYDYQNNYHWMYACE